MSEAPSSKLSALRAAEPLRDSHWPGHPELPLKIRSLTNNATLTARAAAVHVFEQRRIQVTQWTLDALEEEIATQILFFVLRDPVDPKKPFAMSVDDLRDNSTPDERAVLIREYEEHSAAVDPSIDQMPEADLTALLDEIKKKGPTLLKSLGRATLERLLLTTVAQSSSSPTGKSSTSPES